MGFGVWGLGFGVYRNCIGFGSGVLRGFAGFCFLLLQFDFWIWGTAGGFCFLLVLFGWAGLGWAAAGLFSRTFREVPNYGRGSSIRSEIHTISIYPALEGLGFRVWGLGFGV